MESSPFFSIVIPAYNCSAYLKECIRGVNSQTFPNWEVIIIDDGSKDDSYAIAKDSGKADPRIRVIQHPGAVNRGVSASRNLGVEYAQGAWIAFLDADDVWQPQYLERYFNVISEHPDLIFLYSKACFVDSRGAKITGKVHFVDSRGSVIPGRGYATGCYGAGISGRSETAFERSLKGNFSAPTSSVVAPKAAIREVGGFEEALTHAEDDLLWYQLIAKGPVYFIDDVLLSYRIHPHQWNARTDDMTKASGRLVLYRHLIARCKPEDQKLISFCYVDQGLRDIARGYLLFPAIDWPFVFRSLAEVLTSNRVLALHKLAALGMIPYELIIVPLRVLKRMWKRLFSS